MGTRQERRKANILTVIFLLLLSAVLLPFGIILLNSFKSLLEIAQNILGLPDQWGVDNYLRAWDILEYPHSFFNTLVVTLLGNADYLRNDDGILAGAAPEPAEPGVVPSVSGGHGHSL